MFGPAWAVLNPLAMIIVYTVIFSNIMQAKLPQVNSYYGYSIYLCAGIITWGLFAEIVGRSQTVFIDNANLLKKISFPKISLPAITVLNASLNFVIIFSLFITFIVLSGNFPGWVTLTIIPILVIQILFGISLGIILGVLNVFFRDIGQLFGIVMQFWFWLTPIIYPITILPEKVQAILVIWNPMVPIISAYQTVFVMGEPPNWNTLVIPLIIAIVLPLLAIRLYRKHAGEIVDEL